MKKAIRLIYSILILLLVDATLAFSQSSSCTYTPGATYCNSIASTHNGSFKRGIYVDNFLKLISSSSVDFANSILGVDNDLDGIYEYEKELLEYCQFNGFTTIVLYDIENVLDNSNLPYNGSGLQTYSDHFRRFIYSAKTQYGIAEVEVAIGGQYRSKDIIRFNNTNINEVYCVENAENYYSLDYPHVVNYMNYDYPKECIDLVRRVHNYNLDVCIAYGEKNPENRNIGCATKYVIDRMVTEFEFWTGDPASIGYPDNKSAWLGYQQLLTNMFCARAKSICPLKVDTYLGFFDNDGNTGQYNDQVQADYVDGNVDRVYLHSYKCKPTSLFSYAGSRLALFGANAYNTAEIWPIFSAESYTLWYDPTKPQINGDDYLGQFLTDNSVNYNTNGGYTLACAENQYEHDYHSDPSSASWSINFDGFQWFPYSVIKHNPLHSIYRTSHQPESDRNLNYNIENSELVIRNQGEAFNSSLEIIDADGKSVLKLKSIRIESDYHLPLTSFAEGVYVVRLISETSIDVEKFILAR